MFGYTLDDHVELRPLALEHARAMLRLPTARVTVFVNGFRGWTASPRSMIRLIISKEP